MDKSMLFLFYIMKIKNGLPNHYYSIINVCLKSKNAPVFIGAVLL